MTCNSGIAADIKKPLSLIQKKGDIDVLFRKDLLWRLV